jgi:hypothetical protein
MLKVPLKASDQSISVHTSINRVLLVRLEGRRIVMGQRGYGALRQSENLANGSIIVDMSKE